MKIFEILPQLMKEYGIDALELSDKTGIPMPTIFRLCSNRSCNPTIGTLMPIVDYFNVSMEQLLGQVPLDPLREISTPNPTPMKQIPILALKDVENWESIKNNLSNNKKIKFVSTDYNVSQDAFSISVREATITSQFPIKTFFIIERYLPPINEDYVLVKINKSKNISFKQLILDKKSYCFKPVTTSGKIILAKTFDFFGVIVQTQVLTNYRT